MSRWDALSDLDYYDEPWVPRPNAFFKVEKIPVLGTGKLDLRAIREQAAALAAVGVS